MASNLSEPLGCGLDGNPDLSGLGVRSAFYIQTISCAIAGKFLDAEAGYLHSSTIGLLLAILIALLRETIRGSLFAPEVALVMWLFSIQLAAAARIMIRTVPSKEKRVSATAFMTFYLHLLLVFAFVGYATWFWFAGLDTLPQTACTEWAFFFARVELRGWVRTVNKVLFGIMCSVCGLWVLVNLGVISLSVLIRVIRYIRKPSQKQKTAAPASVNSDESLPDIPDTVLHFSSPKMVALTATFMLWAALRVSVFLGSMITSVELSIQWNEIRDVQSLESVSQLVPFIIALGQFVHVAYTTIRGKDTTDYANRIRDPVDPRFWKKVKKPVTFAPCPDKGNHKLDEEQHEMIAVFEEASAQEEVAPRASIDTTPDVGGLRIHWPASYVNLTVSPMER